jgi:PRTRC genetic system ThiF family protein
VTLIDGDTVSETNCVRQPFTASEIGHNKATILATRTNLFWGLEWQAVPYYLEPSPRAWPQNADIVIGCVDSRKARLAIAETYQNTPCYWLDFGNDAESGQFVLGEIRSKNIGTTTADRIMKGDRTVLHPGKLPTAAELWPEIIDPALDEGDGPSCSAVEALTRQAPFVNQVLANHGLALLAQLFRLGEVRHHGGFVNLADGRMTPIPVPAAETKASAKSARKRGRAAA